MSAFAMMLPPIMELEAVSLLAKQVAAVHGMPTIKPPKPWPEASPAAITRYAAQTAIAGRDRPCFIRVLTKASRCSYSFLTFVQR